MAPPTPKRQSPRPARLAGKLLEVRERIDGGLSQNGLIKRLGLEGQLTQAEISMFERGVRVPPIPVILAYADLANVYMEVLARDELDLPAGLPAGVKHEGVRHRPTTSQSKSKPGG